jgi:hypothetical protein
MTDPVVIWDEHRPILSILPVIAAAVIFLMIGFVCAVKPYLFQQRPCDSTSHLFRLGGTGVCCSLRAAYTS